MDHAQGNQPEELKPTASKISSNEIKSTESNQNGEGQEMYGTGSEFYRFGSEVKARFLQIAPKLWPNVGKMCRAVGISRQTYHNHMKADPVFREAMQEICESTLDDLEEINVKEGKTTGKEAFLPRISTLKAYRKAIYDPARVVKVEGLQMGDGERRTRLGVVETVIDAEVSKTYLDRRQIKEANQKKNSEALGGSEGKQPEEKGGD